MINTDALKNAAEEWLEATPFPHFHVDNFFEPNIAEQLEAEMPDFNSDVWHEYGNAIEVKKVCNNWNAFPSLTYQVFAYLNSNDFVTFLGKTLFENDILSSDFGLNGGGWHIHSRGGKLNTHLDYSLHPKTRQQRKLNIIVYLNSNWEEQWGGSLGLWGNDSDKAPGPLVKQITPKFNRAVIFDTTCNSWHGLPDPIDCPNDQFRKSLAVYYLTTPDENVSERGKALFAPTEEQKNDLDVLNLISQRSNSSTAAEVYRSS
ncbi:2OG-Fe(II) oxygenase [Alphaproteobacteria bacterium LSUCC0744]